MDETQRVAFIGFLFFIIINYDILFSHEWKKKSHKIPMVHNHQTHNIEILL